MPFDLSAEVASIGFSYVDLSIRSPETTGPITFKFHMESHSGEESLFESIANQSTNMATTSVLK